MAGSRLIQAKRQAALRPRLKIWLEADDRYAFGFGLCEMLEAVRRCGAIKQAARALVKSYRYVWGRIKEAEGSLGQQLVETQVGGQSVQRSRLTPAAERLVREFTALRNAMKEILGREYARRFAAGAASSGRFRNGTDMCLQRNNRQKRAR